MCPIAQVIFLWIFFDYDRIISLDFFNSYQIICLDYFFFVSLQRENS